MNSKYTREIISEAVNNASHIDEIFLNLGLKPNGRNYSWLKKLINEFGLQIPYFDKRKKLKIDFNNRDISNGVRIASSTLNNFLRKNNIEKKCKNCGLNSWLGEPIGLDIDHINNNPIDNNLLNLQYLCPNCHRMKTSKVTKQKRIERHCKIRKFCICGNEMHKLSKVCKKCAKKTYHTRTKISWPTQGYFKELVWEKPLVAISKLLGVSDVSIRKFLIKNNIPYPNLYSGYWFHYNSANFEKCLKIRQDIELKFNSQPEI